MKHALVENRHAFLSLKLKIKDIIQRPLFIVPLDVCGLITPITTDNKNYLTNLNCDNGREYLSSEMKKFCKQNEIPYYLTVL